MMSLHLLAANSMNKSWQSTTVNVDKITKLLWALSKTKKMTPKRDILSKISNSILKHHYINNHRSETDLAEKKLKIHKKS